ncbi:MAG: tetratricopeptide repeat protein [Bacteroidia bacterium]
MAFGCKSTKQLSSSSLGYKEQKQFEKEYFEGNKQKVLKNGTKALESYNKALEIYPSSHATMYQLAKLYYQDKKYTEALYYAEQSVEASPKFNHWYSGQLAQFYHKFGKYAQSAEEFAKMVENEPDVRENYKEAASQYFNAKEYDKSVAMLEKMQDQFGVDLESATRLEYVFSKTGQHDKAVLALEKLEQQDLDNIKYKGFLAETYLNAGQEQKAIDKLREVISIDPNVGKAYFALYTIYTKNGNEKLALKNLQEAFKHDDVSLLKKLQAVTPFFIKMKRSPEIANAMKEMSTTLTDNYPNQIQPYLFKADISGTLGEYEDARDYVRQALQIEDSDFKIWRKLISLNVRLKDDEKQLTDVEDALELFPNMVELYSAKGYSHMSLGQYDEAIDITNEGLDLAVTKNDKMDLLQCQATVYGESKNHKKADRVFERMLTIDKYNTTALNNYAFSLAERKVELNKADSLISLALKIEPSNPFFLDTKAWILYGKKEYKEALKLLDQCMEIDPQNPEYYRHSKIIFLELGNKAMADDMQKKINELNEKQS